MLLVAIVRRPHGLAGEVSVEVVTEFPQRFVPRAKLTWRRGEETRELEVASVRGHPRRLLLSFAGIADVEAARGLAGGELCVGEEEAFPAPAGFYYSHQLEGFSCEDSRGRPLGLVVGLGQAPAGPMLTVRTTTGKEVLVPFVEEMIVKIDRGARRVVLELPEGLLDL